MNKNFFLSPRIYAGILFLSPLIAAGEDIPIAINEKFTAADITMPPAQELPSEWSFSDCIDWAAANTTSSRRNMLDILQAEQDVLSAKDGWLPSVGFNTRQSYTNFPSAYEGQNGNTYGSTYGISADWTVWDGNLRKYKIESSKLLLSQKYLAEEDQLKTLKLGILEAYMNILYAREAVEIAERTLEVSDAQTKRAYALMESGRTSKVDYAQIESQRAQDEYNLVQANNNLANACLSLKKILELGLTTEMTVKEVKFPDSEVNAPLPDKNAVYSSAMAWLPQFRSNELSKEIYANDIKAAKSTRLPQISLSGGVSTGYTSGGPGWGSQMGHNFNENIGLNLNIPIFDANSAKRAEAKARLSSLDYDLTLKSLSDDLSNTLESLYIDSSNARAGYQAGLSRLEAASLTNDLTSRQFELGLVNPLELLTAHNNLLTARLELLQSKYMSILASKTINFYLTGNVTLP